jgi:hypothetical protein
VPAGRPMQRLHHLPTRVRPRPDARSARRCRPAACLLECCGVACILRCCLLQCYLRPWSAAILLNVWLLVLKSLSSGVKKSRPLGLKRAWHVACLQYLIFKEHSKDWSTAACELIIVWIRSYAWFDASFLQSSDCELQYLWFTLICLIKI